MIIMTTKTKAAVRQAAPTGQPGALVSGTLLGRDDWKSQVRALIADRNGNDMPDFDEYLESLAEEYYDSALADGLPPETPQEAVWNEWSAAQ